MLALTKPAEITQQRVANLSSLNLLCESNAPIALSTHRSVAPTAGPPSVLDDEAGVHRVAFELEGVAEDTGPRVGFLTRSVAGYWSPEVSSP